VAQIVAVVMFNKVHRFTVVVPIPNSIPPDAVVKTLHAHSPLLAIQPLMHSWYQIPYDTLPEKVRDDSEHFATRIRNADVVAYEIVETIALIPGVGSWATKDIKFPGRFQNLPNGVKTSANAPGGVVVKGQYRVEFRDGSEDDDIPYESGESGWYLVEDTSVECSALMMPLVAWNLDSSHKGMLEKLLESIHEKQGTLPNRPPTPPPKD